jgi:PAS domain S-box-containing protein
MLLNARPVLAENGKPRRILLAMDDVSERKQLEVLQESEQRFRTLAEALPQLVWTCFPDGESDYFNAKWMEFTGIPLEGLFGTKWREVVHPVDRERSHDPWWAALKGAVPYDLDFRLRRADGEYHWFKSRATPLRDNEGRIIKWFGTCTDIEDQKRIAEELENARADLEIKVEERTTRLQETVQELEAFSYSISHDLRAPLRSMLGFANIALSEGDRLSPGARDALQRIMTAANRLDRLIQDVLAYSRVIRAEVRLAPVDLDRLVREVIEQYPGFEPGQAEIEIETPLLPVLGHEASLTQCVANLLTNAVKFVPPGTTPRIRIRTEPADRRVKIWFEDNGIGIDPADATRIFSMFERVHARNQYEGTGIGLAIVRKAVERMGGTTGVESEVGKGSRFWIELKRAEGL